jgi:hypothetical protein
MRRGIKYFDIQEEAAQQSAALVASPASSSSSPITLVALLTKAVLYGAPVVFGILFVRMYAGVVS